MVYKMNESSLKNLNKILLNTIEKQSINISIAKDDSILECQQMQENREDINLLYCETDKYFDK